MGQLTDGEVAAGVVLVMVGFLAFCVVWKLVGYFRSGPDERMRRAMNNARRVSIAETPEGDVVRIDGRVVEGETVEAPLTGRRCVYYAVTVGTSDGEGWHERASERGGVRFVIDDGTGRAIVEPQGARFINPDRTMRPGILDDPTARQAAFLARHGIGQFFGQTLDYYEHVFEIGESIAVMGRPVRELEPDEASRGAGVYRDPPPPPVHLLVIGSSTRPMMLTRHMSSPILLNGMYADVYAAHNDVKATHNDINVTHSDFDADHDHFIPD